MNHSTPFEQLVMVNAACYDLQPGMELDDNDELFPWNEDSLPIHARFLWSRCRVTLGLEDNNWVDMVIMYLGGEISKPMEEIEIIHNSGKTKPLQKRCASLGQMELMVLVLMRLGNTNGAFERLKMMDNFSPEYYFLCLYLLPQWELPRFMKMMHSLVKFTPSTKYYYPCKTIHHALICGYYDLEYFPYVDSESWANMRSCMIDEILCTPPMLYDREYWQYLANIRPFGECDSLNLYYYLYGMCDNSRALAMIENVTKGSESCFTMGKYLFTKANHRNSLSMLIQYGGYDVYYCGKCDDGVPITADMIAHKFYQNKKFRETKRY